MPISTNHFGASTDRLPPVQIPKFSNLRPDANPILAAHMLQEMYKLVTDWQQELQEIECQSIEINTRGPILAAWLESRTFKRTATGSAIPTPYLNVAVEATGLSTIDPEAGYRLCGLDEYGALWTRPCSMAEILSVSQAIARYQQLKDLNARQQQVEAHIRQILEDLVHLRMKLED
ncbi:hypothetical protein [Chamaesiphon sp. VAR_69_metabat_338]|uniref:hypothetical protein n=1 Tax=Chamaesiphon sp. VAR_69_metabat_338 TaxID=2964704 RepID=UPI00286E581E|nr:hypothetical protein [Chamaesiphon sp. VAR_69_metabat_338]